MIKNKFFFIFFILFSLMDSRASDVTKYELRRFDKEFYQNSYTGKIKNKIETINKYENDIKTVKTKPLKKNKKYEGFYKIGKPYTINGNTYFPREEPNYNKIGMASWYGKDFHNRKTANGETYNMNDYTAAHPTLPLPSIVRVTNLENGKSVKVRLNDRGPFTKNRILDVSKRVAKELEFHEQGTTKVRVEFLKKESEELLKEYGLK